MDALVITKSPALTSSEPLLLFRSFDRMEDFWGPWESAVCDSGSIPIDLYETDDEVLISAELPGVKADDIDIDLEGNCGHQRHQEFERDRWRQEHRKRALLRRTNEKAVGA